MSPDAAIPPVAEPEAPAQPAQLSDAEIAAKFDLYDTDGDGFLRPEDLVQMLGKMVMLSRDNCRAARLANPKHHYGRVLYEGTEKPEGCA